MNLKDLKTEDIKNYIQAEREKGRDMREIVKEVAANRDDFTILSHDLEISERQVIESVKRQQKS
ncbi:MAG: hypothetical protein JOZ78_02580 [Chroococcidiopsidaceae cyanobacterium CP_BM_ER_R8_30]|nr:hypothetical protein [Chroococcidiopsidaceae cyanobacterium CP_BM_ER_R8_30]